MMMYEERAAAVRQLVDQARQIEKSGVTTANLEKIGGLLAKLARRADLFPQGEFPLGPDGGIYRLSEDPDHRFALYASAGGSGKKVPPHNHTTWAIIAGVHGEERNVVYDRLDNGAQPDKVQLREATAKEKTLRNGDFIAYLPDDFHHIETPAGSGNGLHLHFYGLSLEHLPDRRLGRHGERHGQALHGEGQDPDAAAHRAAGQGDAEVGRGLRLLRRARGGRVLDQGSSAVRDAPALVAARAARLRAAARSRHRASC
jgi:predicted metal-dependent enzyme (double-stranded beta helix superfamily)